MYDGIVIILYVGFTNKRVSYVSLLISVLKTRNVSSINFIRFSSHGFNNIIPNF